MPSILAICGPASLRFSRLSARARHGADPSRASEPAQGPRKLAEDLERGHRFVTAASLERWRNPECVIAVEESLALLLCVVADAESRYRRRERRRSIAGDGVWCVNCRCDGPITLQSPMMANAPLCKNEGVQSRLGQARSAGRSKMLLIL